MMVAHRRMYTAVKLHPIATVPEMSHERPGLVESVGQVQSVLTRICAWCSRGWGFLELPICHPSRHRRATRKSLDLDTRYIHEAPCTMPNCRCYLVAYPGRSQYWNAR